MAPDAHTNRRQRPCSRTRSLAGERGHKEPDPFSEIPRLMRLSWGAEHAASHHARFEDWPICRLSELENTYPDVWCEGV